MNAIRRILLPIAALAVSLGPVLRAADSDSPTAETVRVREFLADRILDGLDGRDWLVSGPLDEVSPALIRRAKERGIPLVLLDRALPLAPEEVREKVKGLGEGLDEAASVNPFFFARAWMESAPDEARAHLAMLEGQEVWRAASYDYVPSGLTYLGALNAEAAREGLDARYEAAEEAWDEAGEFLLESESGPSSPETADLRRTLRRSLSRAATEFGALLESAGMEDRALEAYTRAYRFDGANVSALMNRASLVKRGRMPGAQGEIVSELNRHNVDAEGARLRWVLASVFGPVVHPEDFVPMGWPWALSGIPVSQGTRLEEALEPIPEANRPAILRALVDGWGLQTRGTDRAKVILGELRDPAGRARMALVLMRDLAKVDETGALRDYWADMARKAGASEMDLLLADVTIALGAREPDKAEKLLEEGLLKEPESQELWRILVSLQGGRGDARGLRRSVAAIGLLKGLSSGLLPYAKGMLAMAEQHFEEARALLLEALETAPGDVAVLEPLLKLDMQFGGPPAAKDHAEAMLKVQPEHAFARYILGSIAYASGDYETAAAHLGRSVASDAQPYALNDYACALSGLGRYQEAAQAISAALQKSPDNPAMLDTYAEALIGLEKWDEAEKIVAKAAAAAAAEGGQGMSGVFRLRRAQILLHKGDREGAASALREAEPFRKDFGAAETKLFENLEHALSEPAPVPRTLP